MLFDTAQMPFVTLKSPFYFILFLIIYVSTEEKNPEERGLKSKRPRDALLFFIGIFQEKPTLFIDFNFVVKVCLALFLIYRFNNYRKHEIKFTELDRKVCYSSGIYILIISFIDYINSYTDTIKKLIVPYTSEIIAKFQ